MTVRGVGREESRHSPRRVLSAVLHGARLPIMPRHGGATSSTLSRSTLTEAHGLSCVSLLEMTI